MYKVVYNGCYGGFSLSLEAARMLAEKGLDEAKEYVNKKRHPHDFIPKLQRHDKRLVEVVEALEDKVNGKYAKLRIAIIYSNNYIIEDYDGRETVVEPEDIAWIEIKEE